MDRERGGQVGGRVEELRIASADRGSHGEERDRSGRDAPAGPCVLLLARVELAEHDPDGPVQVLESPVRPRQQVAVLDTGDLAQDDDVLAPQGPMRPRDQRPQPLGGLGTGVEQLGLHGVRAAVGAVDGPGGRPSLDGGGQVGAVNRHPLHVRGDVDGRRPGRGGFNEAERPSGGPGRSVDSRGSHRLPGVASSPSPVVGPQSHSATTVPVSLYRARAPSSRTPSAAVNQIAGNGPYAFS